MLQKNTARSRASIRRQSSSQAKRQAHTVAGTRTKAQRQHLLGKREQQLQKITSSSREAQGQTAPRRLRLPQPEHATVEQMIQHYVHDHESGNHSAKTVEWHQTALGLFRHFLAEEQGITLIREIEAVHISAWFTHLRKHPGKHGKMRQERTVQTYARSVRAFFFWLVRQGTITENPFARVTFPKVGRPLIKTISEEEFEQLLLACAPPNEDGPLAARAAARNRAILWLFYDTGIRLSELINLRVGDVNRKQGVITVKGKGAKERRIALGQNCLRQMLSYLDRHRPDEEELAEWGNAGEDHLFLAETRQPLTKNGVTLLFTRLKKRAGITGKRISPHIFRHTFALRYLLLGNDPFSLQELLGHEDMTTVKHYLQMNDQTLQQQKRKFSPGDHLSIQMADMSETRLRGFLVREQKPRKHK